MNNFEKYLTRLLQGHLSFDTQVVKTFSQAPTLPVVTLDLSAGVNTDDYIEWDITDDGDIFKRYYRKAYININVWCNTEEQRQTLCNEILALFVKEQCYHPMYCVNYNSGKCEYTGDDCFQLEMRGHTNFQCGLDDYEEAYKPLRVDCNILDGSVNIEPPFDMDDLNENPPLLRSILKAECEYFDVADYTGIQ